MQYIIDSKDFDHDWDYLMSLFAGTGAMLLLYGIYINLFLLSLHTLSRRKAPGVKQLSVASWVMAILGTTQMVVNIAMTAIYARGLQQAVHSQVDPQLVASLDMLEVLQDLSFALNKWLYRCYVILGSQRKIVILPALLMLSTLIVGILVSTPGNSITDFRIPYSLGTATNILLTTLTGKLNFLVRWNYRGLICSPSQPAEYCGPDV
ncbi:hypothetical protein B0H19DRAFT_1273805 [Mycena capillaripes]|nr:hypothetical protein B0H19DRAFT_1273805 [Mycena capillaripes]